jgi:hypothetical protein
MALVISEVQGRNISATSSLRIQTFNWWSAKVSRKVFCCFKEKI